MRKHIPHPVTRLASPFAKLNILHGGNGSSALYTGASIPEPQHSDSESLKTKDLALEMV